MTRLPVISCCLTPLSFVVEVAMVLWLVSMNSCWCALDTIRKFSWLWGILAVSLDTCSINSSLISWVRFSSFVSDAPVVVLVCSDVLTSSMLTASAVVSATDFECFRLPLLLMLLLLLLLLLALLLFEDFWALRLHLDRQELSELIYFVQ